MHYRLFLFACPTPAENKKIESTVYFLAAGLAFLTVVFFLGAAFLAAGLALVAFLAAGFLAVAFLAAGFLVVVFFLVVVYNN